MTHPSWIRELESVRGPALFITRNNLALAAELDRQAKGLNWTVRTKDDLKGVSAGGLLALLRSRRWSVLLIEDRAEDMPRRRDLYRSLLVAGKSRIRLLLTTEDGVTRAEPVHRWRSVASLTAALAAEGVTTLEGLSSASRLTRRLDSRSSGRPGLDSRPPRRPGAGAGAGTPRAGSEPLGTRVAVIKTEFWFGLKAGGSVSHGVGVLAAMRRLGLEPRLWTTSVLPGAPPDVIQKEIRPTPRPSLIEEAAMAAFNRTFLDRVERDVRAFRPSVIYHRHGVFTLAGLALARRLGVPLVLEVNASEVWAREAWSRLYFGGLARRMERVAFERADRLVLISEELIPTVESLGGDRARMVVNPNGVDVERFAPESRGEDVRRRLGFGSDDIVCGFVATFHRWHGVVFLAEQLPALMIADPRLRFMLVGDGDLRPEAENMVRAAGLSERVRFTGLMAPAEVPAHLAACDILLSPHLPFDDGTPFFGSPTKLFEYLAAGRPVVASRLGQIGRVVEDGTTGLLFEPGDAAAFRSAVLRLAADPQLRTRLGRDARMTAERRYTWEANVRRALDGFADLDADPKPTGSP